MNPKFLILYIIAATLAFGLAIYQLIATDTGVTYGRIILNFIMAAGFYYLAYKTYHEKKDQELM
ncbi:hypothetical protein [Mucilaginibacter sp. L3T2-6]|uniref:hypothetical protein n=1 Tax=Mucilaginibacter sp. L3T2-6 TaxID=3062491 RepID=UPI002675D85A|nr:hypothetical protein [Mucilaginibacter sp. L3T2-6]MDO3641655.1 hypothetical protein [Mucilaginibacter sp. L3T2-6]MDV6214149.1 hypothetical protein [Mucilaginibacter sp. L3T2-6]